jgi:hypothetical protein
VTAKTSTKGQPAAQAAKGCRKVMNHQVIGSRQIDCTQFNIHKTVRRQCDIDVFITK